MRNFVLDVVNEGRKQNTIYLIFDADVTPVCSSIKELKKQKSGKSISLTSYILHCFVKVIDENRLFNSYRLGKKKLVLFDDVDVSVMVEKEIDGALQPIHYIVRSANNKTLIEIQKELSAAKHMSFEEMIPKRDRFFFNNTPGFLRKLFWRRLRKYPHVKKAFAGTVGLTNIGMAGEGISYLIPITPMTTTLAIGGISNKTIMTDGALENRDFISLNLCVNHDIIDGAPLMRFKSRLEEVIKSCLDLTDLPADQSKKG